jgi:hypothetical protein
MKEPAKAPWKQPNPQKKSGSKMTPEQVAAARARAAAAGRLYPNLIDNMAVMREAKKKPDPLLP